MQQFFLCCRIKNNENFLFPISKKMFTFVEWSIIIEIDLCIVIKMKIFDYRAAIFYVKGHRNMKFTRKDLPLDQMKRANITTCLTVTMAYVFYILIMLTSDRTTLEKIIFVSFYVIWCKETLRMSKKEKSEKNRKKLRNPENMGFSTFLFLKIDILGVAKK